MIQFSAVPSTALPVLPDQPIEIGAESPVFAEFAALLALQSAATGAKPAQASAAVVQPAAGDLTATGRMGGKVDGKLLPLAALPAVAHRDETASAVVLGLDREVAYPGADETDELPQALSFAQLFGPLAFAPLAFAPVPLAPSVAPPVPGEAAAQPGPPQGLPPQFAQAPLPQPFTADPGVHSPHTGAPAQPTGSEPLSAPQAGPQPVAAALADNGTATLTSVPFAARLSLIAPVAAAPLQAVAQPDTKLAAMALAVSQQDQPVQAPAESAVARVRARLGRSATAEQIGDAAPLLPASHAPAGDDTALPAPSPVGDSPLPPTSAPLPQDQSLRAAMASAPTGSRDGAAADFSALVDRLVAAREAALASRAPQAVHAAIAHAEFGQISLRFEQQDGTLSVAMASADPDFAATVLAAAPPAQQGTDTGDKGASTGRQDGGQQMAQPQAQSQSGGAGAHRSQTAQPQPGQQQRASAESSAANASNDAQAPHRRGIFA